MKIFSLQSKTNLIIWSVVLGYLINYIILYRNLIVIYNCSSGSDNYLCENVAKIFWPFQNQSSSILFWVLIVFVILNLVRYFKYKNSNNIVPKPNV